MALEHLFARCPVLPVDPSLSLARYLHSVEQTRAAALACERPGPEADIERAALLHIRVVQLVAKTLPSHPDRVLPGSAPTLERLNAAAHESLDAVERISHALSATPSAPPALTSAPPPAAGVAAHELLVPAPLLDVFANMVRERSQQGRRAVGVLAGRVGGSSQGCDRVIALIVPPQAHNADPSMNPVIHEDQVLALAAHKVLTPVGVIVHAPTARRARLVDGEREFATRMTGGGAVAVVVAPEDDQRVASFEISDGETREAENVVFVEDELTFKLYDLRPIAKVAIEKADPPASEASVS